MMAMRLGGFTALIERVTTSCFVAGQRQHARRLHLELPGDLVLAIDLQHAIRADERHVPVRTVGLHDDVVRLGGGRKAEFLEVDRPQHFACAVMSTTATFASSCTQT